MRIPTAASRFCKDFLWHLMIGVTAGGLGSAVGAFVSLKVLAVRVDQLQERVEHNDTRISTLESDDWTRQDAEAAERRAAQGRQELLNAIGEVRQELLRRR